MRLLTTIAMAGLAAGMGAEMRAQTKIELEGRISANDGSFIEIFNGQVRFDARGAKVDVEDPNFKKLLDLKTGTAIVVEAVQVAGGGLHALRIEINDEKDESPEICGVVTAVDTAARTFRIGPVAIEWNAQTQFKDLSNLREGLLVEARLQIAGGRLVAELVEKEEGK